MSREGARPRPPLPWFDVQGGGRTRSATALGHVKPNCSFSSHFKSRMQREGAFVVAHTASVSHAEALTGAGKVMHADTAPVQTERMLTETP